MSEQTVPVRQDKRLHQGKDYDHGHHHGHHHHDGENIAQKGQSQFVVVFKRLCKNKSAMIGMCMMIFLILVAIFAPLIAPYSVATKMNPGSARLGPCAAHWFGTDEYGRDIFARIVWGARYSLGLGVGAVAINTIIGTLLGAIAGYFGGWVDNLILRAMDILQTIPGTLLAIIMSSTLGPGYFQTILAMSIGGIAGPCRLIRGNILQIRGEEYIEAATAINASNPRIIATHILPNSLAPLIINTAMGIGGTIMGAAGLSYIGLGVQPPTPEWGAMLSGGKDFIRYYPHMVIFPGLAIAITILAINMFGDGLRDAMDPRLKD